MALTEHRRVGSITQAARFSWYAALGWVNRRGWLGGPVVAAAPCLDPAALLRWRQVISGNEVYLEYGSGASTLEAIGSVAHVISVDTDQAFLSAVQRHALEANSGGGLLHPVHVDVGVTGKWGYPVLAEPSEARLAKWRHYSSAPWALLSTLGLTPTFILVDGRFRVASILESFLRLPDQADCLFMLDDFAKPTRHYDAVLPFAADIEFVGRAVFFRRADQFDRVECARSLERYQADPS